MIYILISVNPAFSVFSDDDAFLLYLSDIRIMSSVSRRIRNTAETYETAAGCAAILAMAARHIRG